MTIPSDRCCFRPRLYTKIAREMTGVGVTPSSRWMMVSTPLAARTSSAVRWAGADSVRVLAHVEGAIRGLAPAVVADRLGDGQDVGFRLRTAPRRASVSTGPEADQLVG